MGVGVVCVVPFIVSCTDAVRARRRQETRKTTCDAAREPQTREFRDVVFEDVVFDNNSHVTP